MSGGGAGDGPFGSEYFGEFPWSLETIVEGIPDVYQEQDAAVGSGTLRALLEGLAPSLDDIRHRIRDYDQLRDPLLVPVDTDFNDSVVIIRTDDQGDGTSIVFLSQGPNGDKFDGVRAGMTLTDLTGTLFTIDSVASSALPSDVTNPPIDPATGELTGKHVVVENIGQSSTEIIPSVSGIFVTNEEVSAVGAVGSIVAIQASSFVDGETFTLNDGVNAPVVFEFDTVPDGVTPGHVEVNISASTTALDVSDVIVSAINNVTDLNLQASNASGAMVTDIITNFGVGTVGNVSWSDTVANPGFVVTSPTGGSPGAFPLDPAGINDGVALAPYIFNAKGSYVGGLDLASNRITISWTESGVPFSGFFTAEGLPGGDLSNQSTINYSSSAGTLAAGQFKLYNNSGAAIDVASIFVTYTNVESNPTEDAVINAQNILAFLAGDVGIKLDRNDPEFLQRSYVNNAFKLWDIKGTSLGYSSLGEYAGYFVNAQALYSVSVARASSLPPQFVFEFPAGVQSVGGITAIAKSLIFDGETFTLDDGVNSPTVFEFDTVPDGASGSHVAVDISSASSAIAVATAIVGAINSVGGTLNLTADNSGGTSSEIIVTNGLDGVAGNVTWSDTVSNPGFIITQPTGGADPTLFTTINPGRGQFDDISLDALPLDFLCSDSSYPQQVQNVTATSVVQIDTEGSNMRALVTVSTSSMQDSFDTDALFVDANSNQFDVQNYSRINSSTYSFEVTSFVLPVVGAGTCSWQVLKFESPNTVSITGIGDVIDLGVQYAGYSGHRYRITKTFTDTPILTGLSNWTFIDSDGVISYIESFQLVSGSVYQFEIISSTPPAIGPANIFYNCELITSCDFCRASSIIVRISPGDILNYPSALEGDALDRLVIRLQQMVPAHVRIASFILDQGPALATWSIVASSTITESPSVDDPYSAIYDEDEYPADVVPTDSSPIIASSTVTITDQNVFEEHIIGPDPIINGTWTATGLWHVTQYR